MLGYALCADAFLGVARANFNPVLRSLVVHQNQRKGVVRCALGAVHVLVTAYCMHGWHGWMLHLHHKVGTHDPVERIHMSEYKL